jgi:hypothetical protein
MKPETIALLAEFEKFVSADPRLKALWAALPQEAGIALGKAVEYMPQLKPSYFHQWYCKHESDRSGLTQRQSYQLFQLGLMFLDQVSRGRYYVPPFVAEGAANGQG